MTRLRLLAVAFFVTISSVPSAAVVRTWVSATTGQDTNDCSRGAPCRTFGRAVGQVDLGGEVVVLDSGGYGPVTITQSVSIISPPGIHAAIAPTTGAAITVTAGTVVLRGLYLNSQGATDGVLLEGLPITHIENVVIHGFSGTGVVIDSGATFIKDTIVRNCLGVGILVGFTNLVMDRVRLELNGTGLEDTGFSSLTVRDSMAVLNLSHGFVVSAGLAHFENCVASQNGSGSGFVVRQGGSVTAKNCSAFRNNAGFLVEENSAGQPSRLVADHCFASRNTNGFLAGVGTGPNPLADLTVTNSTAANNNQNGIVAGTFGIVRAFHNVASGNLYGLNGASGSFFSDGTNVADGNSSGPTIGTIQTVLKY